MMSPVFLQEPCLPRNLEGPLGLLCRLLLQPPLLEPALALASLHPWLRTSAQRPPPPPRVLARLSRPSAGHPNSGCPLYLLPRPLFHREAQQEYTVQWETDKNNKLLHNKYLINPVNLLAVQSWTQSSRILYDNTCPNAQLCILFNIQTHTHYTTHIQTHNRHKHTLVNPNVHAKHNQLSQNPLTGVVTTELEKFYLRTFCLFVAILLSFWFCVLEWFFVFSFSLFTYLKSSNLQWCLYLRSCSIFNLNQLYFCILFWPSCNQGKSGNSHQWNLMFRAPTSQWQASNPGRSGVFNTL